MKLKDGVGTTVLENHYTFDLIGNILSMENVAGVIPGSQLGGPSLQSYGYDQFNRLATATGSWTGSSNAPAGSNQSAEYSLGMDYGPMHRILGKTQNHELDGNVQEANSYANQYEYQVSGKPNAVSRISRVVGGQTQEELFGYDANGNAVSHTFGGGAVGEDRMMLWDETNMMKAIRMGELSFYHNIYDGTGTRVMKGIGDIDVMTVGGQQQLSATTGNYTVYVSPYVTINAHGMLSKHYYAGDDKLATRLAGEAADFDSGTPLSGQNTGSLAARQEDDLQHVYDEFGLGTVDIENLPPAMDDCESQGDCAQVLYYYHKDHIGSSSMVTDGTGAVYQYLMYLPFGESMAEQKLGGYSSRYRFTGKELDPLSGLYDFGARYYDPRLSVWFGVDPLAEKYPGWSPYNYTLNNPIRMIDPDGRAPELITPETAWDIINVVMGVASFGANVATGNVLGAVVDGIGLVYDGAATLVPVLPGGASSAIGAYRFIRVADNLVGSINKVAKLDIIKNSEKLSSLANKAQNSLKQHLKLDDIAGAVQDILGIPVTKDGKIFDHLKEVNEGLGSLQNYKAGLQQTLKNSKNLSESEIKALNSSINETDSHINRINKILDKAKEVKESVD